MANIKCEIILNILFNQFKNTNILFIKKKT